MMRLPAIFAMSCPEDGRWLIVSRTEQGQTFDRREISAVDSRALTVAAGSFEVRFPDHRPPRYFYWDDVPSRRLRPDMLTSEQALEQARPFARAERDKQS
jgi:hypothetical protein